MAVGLVEVNFSLLCLPILYPFTTYPCSKLFVVLPCQTHKSLHQNVPGRSQNARGEYLWVHGVLKKTLMIVI